MPATGGRTNRSLEAARVLIGSCSGAEARIPGTLRVLRASPSGVGSLAYLRRRSVQKELMADAPEQIRQRRQ